MDISFPPLTTANLIKPVSAPAPAPAATAQISPVAAPKVDAPDPSVAYDQAAKKALASFRNTYAVSDHKFALFKDASGQMITRYVSLRDGTVTYSPAPNFLRPVPHIAIHA